VLIDEWTMAYVDIAQASLRSNAKFHFAIHVHAVML
jgi:hypothetical protein